MPSSGSPSASGDTQLLDAGTRARLIAVVVDANSYGRVGPDLSRLANLAVDLARIGIQTWVPQPVAWEWAEHLASEWIKVHNLAKEPLGHLARAGLPPASIAPNYGSREALIETFLLALADTPHLEIVELTGSSAVEGLKDQVLQRKPGKTKSSDAVKTGGSDSAWLRDVVARAGAPDRLLFLSKDNDIKSAFAAWGYGEPLMRDANRVRASLFEDVPASIEDQWLVARYLTDRMPDDLDFAEAVSEGALVSSSSGLMEEIDEDWEDHGLTSASLARLVAFAGLDNVVREAPELHEAGHAPTRHTIRATAFFLAEARLIHIFSSQEGSPVREYTSTHSGLMARTRLVLTVENNNIVEVRPDSETSVYSASRYHDSYDGVEDVLDAMSAVPGLTVPDDGVGWWEQSEQEITVEGMTSKVLLSWSSRHDHGALFVRIGDDEASVVCEYDDTAWAGGKDGMYLDPPYYLITDTGDTRAEGAWLLPSWIISKLLQDRVAESVQDI